MESIVLALPGNDALGGGLAAALGVPPGELEVRDFPDGETYVRIDSAVAGREVVLAATLHRPDSSLLPALLVAATARDLGATHVGLVAPYLAYMRQDARFRPGEGVTSVYVARLLSQAFDWLVTVDPHLHRHASLAEVYTVATTAVQAAPALAAWIARNVTRPVLVGPDGESAQWVTAVAAQAGVPHLVLHKVRRGDREVEVSVPDVSRWHGHTPVVVDDIISTAQTMAETVGHLRRAGLTAPVCLAVHAVFAMDAERVLRAAGAGRVVTSNTIPHVTNAIDVVGLLGTAVRARLDPS